MFNLRINTKVTFSFSKLNKKLDTLLPKTQRRNLRDIANQWKKNIENGTELFAPLAPATVKRKEKGYKGYNPHYPRTKIPSKNAPKPLIATGNLLKSIRVTKKGISFNKYGDWHVKGAIRPKRNWMKLKGTGLEGGRIMSDKNLKMFRKEIRKGFKLAGRGKMIRRVRV